MPAKKPTPKPSSSKSSGKKMPPWMGKETAMEEKKEAKSGKGGKKY
jgi:hypothetical protein